MTIEPKYRWAAWYGLIATPVLSLAALETKYALVRWACSSGQHWVLAAVAASCGLFTAAGAVWGYQAWRRLGSVTDLRGTASQQWWSYLIVLGMMMSLLSTLFVLAMGLSLTLLGACD